jgi:protein-tyrosine phosphatase
MIKILFVCHGNICRSPMAEFVTKNMVQRLGRSDEFEIASAATSTEELGNPVYPPARKKLAEHGIGCDGKIARQIKASDYNYYDLLIGMDEANLRSMERCFGGDPEGKIYSLLSFAGRSEAISDPWYTGDFEATWQDVNQGCTALLNRLCPEVHLDFSQCRSKSEMYAQMRDRMLWQPSYGENLDAIYDILTGLDYHGRSFTITLPEQDSPIYSYARNVAGVFAEAEVYLDIIKK